MYLIDLFFEKDDDMFYQKTKNNGIRRSRNFEQPTRKQPETMQKSLEINLNNKIPALLSKKIHFFNNKLKKKEKDIWNNANIPALFKQGKFNSLLKGNKLQNELGKLIPALTGVFHW